MQKKINIHNYEAFFLDYIEGNLNPNLANDLKQFMTENPLLVKELERFENISIEKEPIVFYDKNKLKHSLVNRNNFEIYAAAFVENDLNNYETNELLQYVNKNCIENELKLFTLAKIKPNYSIFYNQKSRLKHLPLRKKRYYSIASAAAVLLLFMLAYNSGFYQNRNQIETNSLTSKLYIDERIEVKNIIENQQKNIVSRQEIVNSKTNTKNSTSSKESTNIKNNVIQSNNIEHSEKPNDIIILHINLDSIESQVIPSIEINNLIAEVPLASTNCKKTTGKRIYSATFDLSSFGIAEAVVKSINKVTGSSMRIEKQKLNENNKEIIRFESQYFAFSSTHSQ